MRSLMQTNTLRRSVGGLVRTSQYRGSVKWQRLIIRTWIPRAPSDGLLPYWQKALGTEAVVYGLSTGNLMEADPCEQ